MNSPEVVFPDHFGFCGGVRAADDLLREVATEAQKYSLPVYGYHEIVHNKDVVSAHEERGVIFVDDVEAIPADSLAVISAHGVGPRTAKQMADKGVEVFDATCELVTRTHKSVERAREQGRKVIYICKGKPGEVDELHDEVAGFVDHLDFTINDAGELIEDPVERAFLELTDSLDDISKLLSPSKRYRIVTQTTLDADQCLRYREEIKARIEAAQPEADVDFISIGDVCKAVRDRQKGVEQLVELRPRTIAVVTDPGSKNGMGYKQLAEKLVAQRGLDTEVLAVANADDAKTHRLAEGLLAITASASTPDRTIAEVAGTWGYQEAPKSKDRRLRLEDLRQPGSIALRVSAFVERINNGG